MTRRRARTAADGHTTWCTRGHACNLGEHRGDPLTLDLPGTGRATLTRVRGGDGRDHAEVRLTVALADTEDTARGQLISLSIDLERALHRATRATVHLAA